MHPSHSYVPPEDTTHANGAADMQTVLLAWHDATARLEQTHESLRAEVCRLTAELEQKNSELARQRRLADLGQIAAHVAHEVRNGLVPVSLYLSLLRRRLLDDPVALAGVGSAIALVRGATAERLLASAPAVHRRPSEGPSERRQRARPAAAHHPARQRRGGNAHHHRPSRHDVEPPQMV